MLDQTSLGQFLATSLTDLRLRSDDERRAAFVTGMAVVTLLIDAGLVTIEEAAQRIEAIHGSLPDEQKTEGLRLRVLQATEWLRLHARSPQRRWTPAVIEGGRGASPPASGAGD